MMHTEKRERTWYSIHYLYRTKYHNNNNIIVNLILTTHFLHAVLVPRHQHSTLIDQGVTYHPALRTPTSCCMWLHAGSRPSHAWNYIYQALSFFLHVIYTYHWKIALGGAWGRRHYCLVAAIYHNIINFGYHRIRKSMAENLIDKHTTMSIIHTNM